MDSLILIHHHIFKNAGSTLDFILEKNFGIDFTTLHADSSTGLVSQEVFLKFIEEKKNIKAISSHHFHGQEFRSNNHTIFDIIFLRHPIDRLRSIYDFYHSNYSIDDPLAEKAQNMSLREFINYLLQHHPHQVNDVQVNILANHGKYCRPPNEQDLSLAHARIRNTSLPGTLELFDESLIAAEFFLYPNFGDLDLSYKVHNVSPVRKPSLKSRLKEMQMECGTKLFKQLLIMNQLDLKLLEYVSKEVCRRIQLLPDSDLKLVQFKARCQ